MLPYSFEPILGPKPHVLILGTLPGKESLRKEEYYGHPRNLFWKVIFDLFDKPIEDDYQARKQILHSHHIALWDICKNAIRETSLDGDIKDEMPNDVLELISNNSSIKLIAFNGKKAEKLYNKHFHKLKDVQYVTLLSTSPANASYSYEEKIENWKVIKMTSMY